MRFDPRTMGAKCDVCPMGPKGILRRGDHDYRYKPVPSEIHPQNGYQTAAVACVAECPGPEEEKHGRPFAGKSGGEWNETLRANGLSRQDIDILNVVSCRPPGQASGAWSRMNARLSRMRKTKAKALAVKYPSLTKAEVNRQVAVLLPSPESCCKPRLLNELRPYDYIIALGGTAAKNLTGRTETITSMEGDMIERSSATMFGDQSEDYTVRIVPTYHPAFTLRRKAYRRFLFATVGKAYRWFNDALQWKDPDMVFNPTPRELKKWLCHPSPFWVYDYETDGVDHNKLKVRCLSISTPDMTEDYEATRPGEDYKYLCRSVGINILSSDGISRFYSPEDEVEIKDILTTFFTDQGKIKVGHFSGIFDRQVTEHWLGVTPSPIRDDILLARNAFPDLPKGLKPTGRRMTDVRRWETNSKGEKASTGKVTDQERLVYCCFDTAVGARIDPQLDRIARDMGDCEPLPEWAKPVDWPSAQPWTLRTLDHWRQDFCVEMHKNGVYVNQAKRLELEHLFTGIQHGLKEDLQELASLCGHRRTDFNPASPNQLRDLFYETMSLGMPVGMKPKDFYTDSGLPGTGADVLRGHLISDTITEHGYQFFIKLIQYRRVKNKILGTQLKNARLKDAGGLVDQDSRVRPGWKNHVTLPGRWSCSGPNLQNQANRKDLGGVRSIYCAQPSNVFVACDLASAHLVVMANYWQIERLQECYDMGYDPHCWLAADLFKEGFTKAKGWTKGFNLLASHKPSKKSRAGAMREFIKTYRYASVYQATAMTKLRTIKGTEITELVWVDGKPTLVTTMDYLRFKLRQVELFDNLWHKAEPDWRTAWARMQRDYEDNGGWLESPLFKRRSGCLNGGEVNDVCNYPVLSCEADIMSICETRARRLFPPGFSGKGTGLVMQVHDSLVVETSEATAEDTARKLEAAMNIKVPGWDIPFTAEADIGRTLAEV